MQIARYFENQGLKLKWVDSSLKEASFEVNDAPEVMRAASHYYDADADLMYILGFYNGSAYQNKLYSYSPTTGIWQLLNDNIRSSNDGTSGYNMWKRGDWLYWGLGFETSSRYTIHRYNLVTDTIEYDYLNGINAGVAPSIAYNEQENEVYAFGVRPGSDSYSETTKIIDLGGPNEQVVNNLNIMSPDAHHYGGTAVYHQGYCYVRPGGTTTFGGEENTLFYRYDVKADIWELMAPTPIKSRGGFMWVYKNEIYYHFMSRASGTEVIYLHKYNISDNEWTEIDKNGMLLFSWANIPFARLGNQLWLIGGYDGAETINDTQVLTLSVGSGTQKKGFSLTNTRQKIYTGTFYRNFRVRITQTSQVGSVFDQFVKKGALSAGDSCIRVSESAKVDIRQVRFRFRRIITFGSYTEIRPFWAVDGVTGQEMIYEFIPGCDYGVDIDELFNTGYHSNIIDMAKHDSINGGYEYDTGPSSGPDCDETKTGLGFIHFFVSIPKKDVLEVQNGGQAQIYEL